MECCVAVLSHAVTQPDHFREQCCPALVLGGRGYRNVRGREGHDKLLCHTCQMPEVGEHEIRE
jgi:hypothetical protein